MYDALIFPPHLTFVTHYRVKRKCFKLLHKRCKLLTCSKLSNDLISTQLEVRGRAQREAARRCKSEWKVNLGSRIPLAAMAACVSADGGHFEYVNLGGRT